MSDLISREALLEMLSSNEIINLKHVIAIIKNARKIEQGEPVAELKITWGSDTGYEYGLTLIGGALTSQKEYDDWIVSNFKGEGVFKLYTAPQQPQSVADALEEALGICAKIKTPDNLTDAEKHIFEQATTEYWRAIRALIKRNAEGR